MSLLVEEESPDDEDCELESLFDPELAPCAEELLEPLGWSVLLGCDWLEPIVD